MSKESSKQKTERVEQNATPQDVRSTEITQENQEFKEQEEPVKLYVYDLSNGMARNLSMSLTGKQIGISLNHFLKIFRVYN